MMTGKLYCYIIMVMMMTVYDILVNDEGVNETGKCIMCMVIVITVELGACDEDLIHCM